MVNISKRFGRVQALKNVDFEVGKNEIVGLMGDNGAGKSTLIKILSGVCLPSDGEIYLEGKRIHFRSPADSRSAGIETVYQDMALVDLMSISRNFFLGREPHKSFELLDKKRMNEECYKCIKEIGIRVRSPDEPISILSGGERQSVSIGRALYFKAKLLILDEPTAALSIREYTYLLNRIKSLKKLGVSVIHIAHNVYHVYEVADRFVILDKGVKIGSFSKEKVTPEYLIDVIREGRV
jgi:simple sugar transport system ATP-binding protein